MSLREKTIIGFLWSFVGRFFILAFEFVIGIILTRILSPKEFGLIGMVTIFLVLSETLINSGFSQALIRMPNCLEKDFETAFTFNFVTSLFFLIILFIFAPRIASFYQNSELITIVQVLGLGLVINAISFVQRTRLTRDLDFKSLNQISIISSVGSGTSSLILAFSGFGVWSLVVKTLSRDFITTILLLLKSRWVPKLKFYKDSFNELFKFGSKLVTSGILGIITNNLVYVILGKYFQASDVGYYNRAELFKNLPSQNIENIVTTVAYPILAQVQDDKNKFLGFFRKVLLVTFYIISILMFGLFAVSKTVIFIVLGEEWFTSSIYLMYLCPIGIIYPLWTLNLNVFNIYGKADVYLKLQTIMQILTLISVVSGMFFSIKIMIVLLGISSLLSYFIFAHFAGKHTGYGLYNQIKDILPSLGISGSMGMFVYFLGINTSFTQYTLMILQLFTGLFIVVTLSVLLKPEPYIILKETLISRFIKKAL